MNKALNNKVAYLTAIFIAIAPSITLAGGIADQMKSFWEKNGGYSNYSGPKAYDLQSAGYYSMGGLYARTPVANEQIANISLPSINAGCGGIDIYGGAFSFINSTNFTELIHKIANNSIGFFTQLGIQQFSPVFSELIAEMNALAQSVNGTNINSCETTTAVLGSMWPRNDQASRTICSTLAGASGVASDFAKAKHDCQKDRKGVYNQISDESLKQLIAEDVNIAWKALQDSRIMGTLGEDSELLEMFMTLSGTIIIHAPSGQSDHPKFEYITGKASNNEFLTILLEGGDFKYHKCDEKTKCLKVTQNSVPYTLNREDSFKGKVEIIIHSIVEHIQNDTAIGEHEKEFVNIKTRYPIQRIATVYAAYSGAAALFELTSYAEAIAVELLFAYVDDVISKLELATNALMIGNEDHIKRYKDDLREIRRLLADKQNKINQNYVTLLSLVDRAVMIEGMLAKNIGSPLAESYQWGREL